MICIKKPEMNISGFFLIINLQPQGLIEYFIYKPLLQNRQMKLLSFLTSHFP